MCNHVQLVVCLEQSAIDVANHDEVVICRMPMATSKESLTLALEGFVDHVTLDCASRLWSDDSFPRLLQVVDGCLVITCSSRTP